jgi:hypothetical protein
MPDQERLDVVDDVLDPAWREVLLCQAANRNIRLPSAIQ